jgi:TRAP-type mannitol/chloroaromatic compound transport system substrate-binding protein
MKARFMALTAMLVLVATSAAFAGEAPKTVRWKVQSCFPLNMPLTDNAVALWAKKVQEMSGGRMAIELHGDGAIVKGPAIYEAVRDGVLDAGQNTPAWQKGRFPAGDLLYTLPGGVTEYHDYILWVYGGGGWQLAQEMYKGEVVVFPLGLTPPEEIWTNKPIKSLADFKGLKMRNAGLSMELFQKLGASVVLLAGGEVVPALQRGVIDAAEFSDASMDLALGLPDVAKYVIGPPIHMGSNMFQLLVNPKSYAALPADLKSIVREATISATFEGYARHWSEAIKAFEKIKQKGVTVIKLSPKDQAEARRLALEILEEKSQKDPFFKKMWESQRDFKKAYQPYHNFTAFDQMPQ